MLNSLCPPLTLMAMATTFTYTQTPRLRSTAFTHGDNNTHPILTSTYRKPFSTLMCPPLATGDIEYLIVRNVPALGCGDELLKLFATYGDIEGCKPMDEEECEPYTDVYWIKFRLICNARFAKRKLDDFVFLGNQLNVSYAPNFENIADTREKLEARRKEVLMRLHPKRPKRSLNQTSDLTNSSTDASSSLAGTAFHQRISNQKSNLEASQFISRPDKIRPTRVSSDQGYFTSKSMNETVRAVREKLNKIESSSQNLQGESALKKARQDNRRRI